MDYILMPTVNFLCMNGIFVFPQASFEMADGGRSTVAESAALIEFLPSAAFHCLNSGNRQACNALANLCSLEVYQR